MAPSLLGRIPLINRDLIREHSRISITPNGIVEERDHLEHGKIQTDGILSGHLDARLVAGILRGIL